MYSQYKRIVYTNWIINYYGLSLLVFSVIILKIIKDDFWLVNYIKFVINKKCTIGIEAHCF